MISITGKVIRGDGYGKTIGFPTANIDRKQFVRLAAKIRQGVYAGLVILESGKKYKAGIVIGPLDKKNLPKLEAHVINFRGSLYNTRVTFVLQKFLRPFKKYKTVADLQGQIKKDITKVQQIITL